MKATKKKATKPANEAIILKEGDYFSATFNRKKIRGIVGRYDDEYFTLNNSQGAGEDTKCDDDDYSLGFSHQIQLDNGENSGTKKDLANNGVNNYTVLRDKRQKAIIEKDKLPHLEVGQRDYKVSLNARGEYVFGCGAVEFSEEQIEGYLRYRDNAGELDEYESRYLQDMEVDEIEAYLDLRRGGSVEDRELYMEVVEGADSNCHDEDEINRISEKDIRALFVYAKHLNSKT